MVWVIRWQVVRARVRAYKIEGCDGCRSISKVQELSDDWKYIQLCVGPQAMMPPMVQAAKYEGE